MAAENIASWITAIATAISSLAILAAIWIYRKDHDRSRRQNAVSLIADWSRGLKQNASIAKTFVESLSVDQTKQLWNQKPFKVSKDKEVLLKACLSGVLLKPILKIDGDSISLDIAEVSAIRWLVVSYLNQLESILSAWRHNVADREIIEEEFNYLVSSDSYQILKDFRNAEKGVNTFPAIDEFVKLLHPDSQMPPQGKGKI